MAHRMRSRQEILATLSVAVRLNTSGVQELGHPQSVNDRDDVGGAGLGPPVGGLGGRHAPQVKLSSAFSRTFLNGSTHSVAEVCEAASV
jgi:hypothetical protein